MRRSRGLDIDAACGQLRVSTERKRKAESGIASMESPGAERRGHDSGHAPFAPFRCTRFVASRSYPVAPNPVAMQLIDSSSAESSSSCDLSLPALPEPAQQLDLLAGDLVQSRQPARQLAPEPREPLGQLGRRR